MTVIQDMSQYIGEKTGFNRDYIKLIILTLLVFIVFGILKAIVKFIYSKASVSDKKKYVRNRMMKVSLTTISFIIVFLLWGRKISGFVTIISFLSAGITISVKEIIFDFFAGLYINIKKPFELEDRIEIDGIKGDVVSIRTLGFEILEVGDRVNAEQSTGRIIHIPNYLIFTKPLKNYTKAFKYIWDEVTIKVPLDADIEKTKTILYDIIENNEILKTIPRKMEDAVADVILEYRIYYNHLDPIIYTKIVDSHVELYLRYIVHPKKARNVQDDIYLKILEEYRNGNIELYKV